jgi:SAM-dependent methyltransferase
MSFYSEFAEHYETIFPLRDETYAFLAGQLAAPARRVLDIGCGTGHYCGRFAAAGHTVVGIDLDPEMIAAARARYSLARFECLDMRDVGRLNQTFDFAFCIGNTLAHLPQADLPTFLAALRPRLEPHARWVVQTVNWDAILARGEMHFPVRQLEGGRVVFHREYRELSEHGVRFLTRLDVAGVTRFAGEVTLHPARAATYQELHAQAGFHCLGHYGGYAGELPTLGAPANVLAFERG